MVLFALRGHKTVAAAVVSEREGGEGRRVMDQTNQRLYVLYSTISDKCQACIVDRADMIDE